MRARSIAVALALTLPAAARAEDLAPRKQALLLLRVLAYDRNLATRAAGAVRVAVVYRPGDRASEEQRDAIVASLEDVAREVVVAGLPVEVTAMPYHDPADLDRRVAAARPATLYVCGQLGASARDIATVARRRGTLCAAGTKEMVEAGLAVGLVNRGLRAGVVVNLAAARAEGADLDSALLGIAEVIP